MSLISSITENNLKVKCLIDCYFDISKILRYSNMKSSQSNCMSI